MGQLSMMDYNKVTDTLMYFNSRFSLNFVVNLYRKRKDNSQAFFHSEYKYYNESIGRDMISLKRNIDCFFLINDYVEFNNYVIIAPRDIFILRNFLKTQVLPWIVGNKRVYRFDNNGQLVLKGKFSRVEFPLNDHSYIAFTPCIFETFSGLKKEGIRIEINSKDNILEIDINKFLEFYYYIDSVDMYTAATNILNYINCTSQYGINLYDSTNE